MSKKIILIIFAAFLLRLIALNQSLWLDEATTARVVQQYGYLGILTKFSPFDFHPPLFYWLEKFWTGVFGHSEISLRMPSVLSSLAAGYFVYLIGGVWAAVFFLFNPLIVYYSQEARMYMMATMFLTMALYYFLQLSSRQKSESKIRNERFRLDFGLRRNDFLFFLFFITLAFFTFYGSIFLIAAFVIYLFFKKQYNHLFICLFVIFVDFLVVSPLLYHQLMNARIVLPTVANWASVLGKANLKNLLLIPIKFSVGRIDFYPKWLYYATAGLWTFFVFFILLKNSLKTKNLKLKTLLAFLFVFPLALGFVTSFVTPLLQYFRFIYLIPIMTVILSFGLSNGAEVQPRRLYWKVPLIAAGFMSFSLIYLLSPQFHREDWKSLVSNLPKDIPIYMIIPSSDPVKYYNNNIKVNELRELKSLPVKKLSGEVIVIPYTADIYGFDYKTVLGRDEYKLKDKKTFRGNLEVMTYSL